MDPSDYSTEADIEPFAYNSVDMGPEPGPDMTRWVRQQDPSYVGRADTAVLMAALREAVNEIDGSKWSIHLSCEGNRYTVTVCVDEMEIEHIDVGEANALRGALRQIDDTWNYGRSPLPAPR
jgi:hypothetical protein